MRADAAVSTDMRGDRQLQRLDQSKEMDGVRAGRGAEAGEPDVALEEGARARDVGDDLRLDVRVAADGIELQRLRAVAQHFLALEDLEPASPARFACGLERIRTSR